MSESSPAVAGYGFATFAPRSRVRAYLGDSPWGQLHAAPTLWVIGTSMLLSAVSTYVLDQHILTTKDQVGIFFIGSYIVFSSYFLIYFFLEKYSSSFRSVSNEKKFYTISNLLKAGILMSITPFAATELYRIVVHDRWDTNTLRNLGCIYAIPDFVSMIVVRRMAWTTIFHHTCVQVFNYFSVQNDYQNVNVCRLIVVYAAFSTFAYCVNMLLGSRFLGVSAIASRCLSAAAFFVYTTCCAINWTWQARALWDLHVNHRHWTIYAYCFLILFVVWDDIVLNKWLWLNMRRKEGIAAANKEDEAAAAARKAKRAQEEQERAKDNKTSSPVSGLRMRLSRLLFAHQ